MSKNRIATLLWGDRGDAQARSSLRQVLVELRSALNSFHQLIFTDEDHIWLSADRVTEEPANPKGERKDAFEDLDNVSPEFDEWLVGERSRRLKVRMTELKAEAEKLLTGGFGTESKVPIYELQSIDTCNEDALRLGMKADFLCGEPGAIVRRYGATEALSKAELGVQLSIESRALRDNLLARLTFAAHCRDPSLLPELRPA